ncbi:hypothetical protein [Blastopirellula retiformator]|uniref:Uncharacterized protein n=1 Tax=Blastopirellula retiformator TaxID=2527970 RepID=A0A5C5V2F0_9BACT|nr:hypothetical protein [Blastopirellula retiformator]TWT32658.1 hypothetical protein Enr8_24630 [Blastopirellula retiformator]
MPVLFFQVEPETTASWLDYVTSPILLGAFAGVGLLAYAAIRWLRPQPAPPPDRRVTRIDIERDAAQGPRTLIGPRVEVYHVPVRVIAVVIAPAGRNRSIPDEDQLRKIMEAFAPGMMQVVRSHRPDFFRWPGQLSVSGFAQSFFVEAALPGEKGVGTEWCAVAGRFDCGGQQYLIGLVCCADEENSLSHIQVDRPQQWLDIFRIREAGTK